MEAPDDADDVDLDEWMLRRDGIAHRRDILDAGFSLGQLRRFMRSDGISVLRCAWIALPTARADVRVAAERGGRVACVSLGRRRGWWMPDGIDERLHLHVLPRAASAPASADVVRHWTVPLAPVSPRVLEESPEDALAHIARCLPRDAAMVLWESAIRTEKISVEALRVIRWPTRAAAECADAVTGLSDSGLETIVVRPLREAGLRVRQQIVIAGRPVDVLVDAGLVVQIDGWEFHSSSAQRAKDIAHDAELRLRGYTVLRFSYAQVVHDGPAVQRTIMRAVAAGLHRRG